MYDFFYVVPRIGKLLQKERIVVARRWGKSAMGNYCLICMEFQFGMMKSSGDGQWWRLNNTVNVPTGLNATFKWLKWQILCCEYFITIKILWYWEIGKNTIISSSNSCISIKILLKIKNYQILFAILHLPRATDIAFDYTNWKWS